MPTRLKTIRDLWDLAFDGLAAGGDRDVMTETIEKEGYDLGAPLPMSGERGDRHPRIVGLCEQIVAIAKENPRAGEYYATLVAAAKHSIEVDKIIEDA